MEENVIKVRNLEDLRELCNQIGVELVVEKVNKHRPYSSSHFKNNVLTLKFSSHPYSMANAIMNALFSLERAKLIFVGAYEIGEGGKAFTRAYVLIGNYDTEGGEEYGEIEDTEY
jgi:hypothetical protein